MVLLERGSKRVAGIMHRLGSAALIILGFLALFFAFLFKGGQSSQYHFGDLSDLEASTAYADITPNCNCNCECTGCGDGCGGGCGDCGS